MSTGVYLPSFNLVPTRPLGRILICRWGWRVRSRIRPGVNTWLKPSVWSDRLVIAPSSFQVVSSSGVAIVRALLSRPEVVFADEPTR